MAEEPVTPQQQTIRTKIKLATFIGFTKSPSAFDESVNDFLGTIDNQKRFLNGRNAYAVGEDKVCVQIWYLEAIEPEAVVKPLGKKHGEKETKS